MKVWKVLQKSVSFREAIVVDNLPPDWQERHKARDRLISKYGPFCKRCRRKFREEQLIAHHLYWVGYRDNGFHRDGYNINRMHLLCIKCDKFIHSHPKKAEKEGFKLEKLWKIK